MNNFEIHDLAEMLSDTNTSYSLARALIKQVSKETDDKEEIERIIKALFANANVSDENQLSLF